MLVQQLLRIPEFRHAPKTEVHALVRRARVLCLPSGRWLLRNGRKLDAFLYLLNGAVLVGQQYERASKHGALRYFYPGCVSAKTQTTAQVLWVDAAHHEFLTRFTSPPEPISATADSLWLERFLNSQMMQQVQPGYWQQLISAFKQRQFAAGDTIIVKGAQGSECFVIEQGHCVVHDQGRTLCHLGAGDFFGEDALVVNGARNANVTALQSTVVHAIAKRDFCRLLLEQVVEFVAAHGDGTLLRIADGQMATPGLALSSIREHAQLLDVQNVYYICGGSRSQRALAALLLIQRGLRAHPLVSDT